MDEEYDTGYIQTPFSCFIQNNDDEEFESTSSLSSFIKVHSSNKGDTISQPSNLLDEPDSCDDLSSYVNKSLNPVNEKGSIYNKPDELDDCNTLEEYTKSFLNSKGNYPILNRFRTQSENSNCDSKSSSLDLTNVKEQFSKIQINSNQTDNSPDHWNIDLSVALQNSKIEKVEPDKFSKSNESNFTPQIYLAHVQLCSLDVSALASEKLPYSDGVLSSFGYVLNRKWPKLPLPKKTKKIGKHWPYNQSKSFKFDSPSPDDVILKKKAKMRTNSYNDS